MVIGESEQVGLSEECRHSCDCDRWTTCTYCAALYWSRDAHNDGMVSYNEKCVQRWLRRTLNDNSEYCVNIVDVTRRVPIPDRVAHGFFLNNDPNQGRKFLVESGGMTIFPKYFWATFGSQILNLS